MARGRPVRSRVSRAGTRARTAVVLVAVIGIVATAGCSSSSSSKPAYCTDRANLESSVKGLSSPDLSSGLSSLEAQLKKIESNATALVNSAKSGFPSQTSAITSSVDSLKSAVTQLASDRSAVNALAVTTDAANVVKSVKSFTDATSSNCS
jgi:hypothetical protein